jgi:hypothetical protein
MLTTCAAAGAMVSNEMSDGINIRSVAHGVSGIIAVGLHAVASVNERCR